MRDLEGIFCVIGEYNKALAYDTPSYAYARRQATKEANAAATALFDSGAAEVWVWDCHAKGYNLIYDELDSRVKIVMGAGNRKRFPMIETGFDGVVFIGYHAYDTPNAVLAHIYSSSTCQAQLVNGESVGELQIDAAIAGKYDVPVLFVSSDDICVSQAEHSFWGVHTVVTKKALAWNQCISEHPSKVCEIIYKNVSEAAADIEELKPYTFKLPFEYEVRFKRIEYAESCVMRSYDNKPFERVDAYTVRGYLADPEDIF